MPELTEIRKAIHPIGTLFNGAMLGTLTIASSAVTLGLTPPTIGAFLLASGCFGAAKFLTDKQTRQTAADNAERLKALSISDEANFQRLRQHLIDNDLDPNLLDELKHADPEADPPALAIMLTLFQASQNGQLETILSNNAQLQTHLAGSLADITELLAKMRDDIVRAAKRASAFPPISLPIQTYNPEKHRNPYIFSLQRVPLLGRDTEFRELLDFCLANGNERIWWLWHAPGGFGKSRLAHELCLHLLRAHHWCVGRLDLRQPYNDWHRVELTADTLFIIDYAAEHPQRAAKAIATLYERRDQLSDRNHRVRFLLLERSADGPWKETLDRGNSSSDQPLLASAEYRSPRSLANIHFPSILDTIEFILKERQHTAPIDKDQLKRTLRNIDPLNRPLYAAILADAIADRGFESLTHWGQGELLEHVLDTEMMHWPHRGVDHAHVNALLLATLSGGGLNLTDDNLPEPIQQAVNDGLLPSPKQRPWATLADFAGTPAPTTNHPLPALEPDILGERFILDRLIGRRTLPPIDDGPEPEEQSEVAKASRQLLRLARLRDPDATAIATIRCIRDHPHHEAVELLLTPPAHDADDAEAWSRIGPFGMTLFARLGALDRADRLHRDLAALAQGKHATPEIRFAHANTAYNLITHLGETQDLTRLDRADAVYRELLALAQSEHATPKIRFTYAYAAYNLITDFGKTKAPVRLHRADAVYHELLAIAQSEHATPEIRFEHAKAAYNLITCLGETQDLARLDRADAVYHELLAIVQSEHTTPEIRLEYAKAGINLVAYLGRTQAPARLDRADEVYIELRALVQGEDATPEIQLAHAKVAHNLITDFVRTQIPARLDRADAVYRDLLALAEGKHATAEIRFEQAKSGVNLVAHFGSTQDPARLERAGAVYRELLALAQAENATLEIRLTHAQAGVNLIAALGRTQDPAFLDRADAVYRELLAFAQGEHITQEIGLIYANAGVNLGLAYHSADQPDRAAELLHKARKDFAALGATEQVAQVDRILALVRPNPPV